VIPLIACTGALLYVWWSIKSQRRQNTYKSIAEYESFRSAFAKDSSHNEKQIENQIKKQDDKQIVNQPEQQRVEQKPAQNPSQKRAQKQATKPEQKTKE